MNKITIVLIALSTLACGLQSNLPAVPLGVLPSHSIAPIPSVERATITGTVNLRDYPEGQGKPSKVEGWLYQGDVVALSITDGSWCYVRAEIGAGYVLCEWVEEE